MFPFVIVLNSRRNMPFINTGGMKMVTCFKTIITNKIQLETQGKAIIGMAYKKM